MKIRTLVFAWIGSLLLLTTLAGASWFDVLLTSDAGGQNLPVSGFMVFPIISALVLVQAAALLVSILTPNRVGRVIAAVLIPIQLWQLVTVALEYKAAIAGAVSSEISKATGVVGEGQLQLVASSVEGLWIFGYLAVLALNIAVLAMRAFMKAVPSNSKSPTEPEDDSSSLWESQK